MVKKQKAINQSYIKDKHINDRKKL